MDNDEKIVKAYAYDALVNGLLDNASLSYYKDRLSFDSDYVNTLLRTFNPPAYLSRLEELNREEEDSDD